MLAMTFQSQLPYSTAALFQHSDPKPPIVVRLNALLAMRRVLSTMFTRSALWLPAVVYLKRVYPSAEFFFKNQTGNHADATMAYENWAE